MTTEVDADYFRKHWVTCSASRNNNPPASSPTFDKPVDEHFAELQARIRRLHESFDSWCNSVAEPQVDIPSAECEAEASPVSADRRGA